MSRLKKSDLYPPTLAASYWHLASVPDFFKKFTIVIRKDDSVLTQKFTITQDLLLEYSGTHL